MRRYIYLHGFASGPGSGKAQYFRRRFAEEGLTLEIPDLAAGDFEHLTISGQLAVVERLAAGSPCVLMGSSMGGYLAALYAARHAEVTRMVLLAPAFGFARRWPESLGAEQVAQWRRTGTLEVFHYGENRMRRLSAALLDDGARYEDFPAFTQPALIFHGSRDTVVPVRYSEEFAAGRPNVTLRVLDSDHELLDQTAVMWAGVREFLLA